MGLVGDDLRWMGRCGVSCWTNRRWTGRCAFWDSWVTGDGQADVG